MLREDPAPLNYASVLSLCHDLNWEALQDRIGSAIKHNENDVALLSLSAHLALRMGQLKTARWLINKAVGIDASYLPAHTEATLLRFMEGDQVSLLTGVPPSLLKSVPQEHPIHLLALFSWVMNPVRSLDVGESLKPFNFLHPFKEDITLFIELEKVEGLPEVTRLGGLGLRSFKLTQALLNRRDLLLAYLSSHGLGLLSPLDPESFGATGLPYFALGKFKLAGIYFSEALFRGSRLKRELLQRLFLVNALERQFEDAIKQATLLQKDFGLSPLEELMLIDIYLEHGVKKASCGEGLKRLERSIPPGDRLYPYLDVLLKKSRLAASIKEKSGIIHFLSEQSKSDQCDAAYLYLFASLLRQEDPGRASLIAQRAMRVNAFHMDAKLWSHAADPRNESVEFLSLFVPRDGEGEVFPSPAEMALIELIFSADGDLAEGWDRFQERFPVRQLTSGVYRLLPSLHKRLAETNVEAPLVKGVWKKSFFENSSRLSLVMPVLDALDRLEIEFVLLKGIANALLLYQDLGSRVMSDVDLLVDVSVMGRVHQLLTEMGWRTHDHPSPPRLRFQYASTYEHDHGAHMDVHWRLGEDFACDFFDMNDFRPFETTLFQGRRWRVLCPSMNLMLTILHGLAWNHLPPNRWIIDSKLILDRHEIEWDRVFSLARKYMCEPPLIEGLKYFFGLPLGITMPQEVKRIIHTETRTPLMRVRFRSKLHHADFEEAHATYLSWQGRFKLSKEDALMVCGDDSSGSIRDGCLRHNILWAPHFDPGTITKSLGVKTGSFNLIAIDANFSCLVRFYCKY